MSLAEVFEALAGPDAPVEFRAYDGSHAGAAGSPVKITVRSPAAVAYLAQAPGGLGLARAYVAGQLDVEGDMYEALARMTRAQAVDLTVAEKLPRPHTLVPVASSARSAHGPECYFAAVAFVSLSERVEPGDWWLSFHIWPKTAPRSRQTPAPMR